MLKNTLLKRIKIFFDLQAFLPKQSFFSLGQNLSNQNNPQDSHHLPYSFKRFALLRWICLLILGSSFALSNTALKLRTKPFAYEQNLQRKHIEQMRFDSEFEWRAWGLLNGGIRNNFIGGNYAFFDALPQIALDRSYPLSNGELMIGVDANAGGGGSMGVLGAGGFGGYGIGGYLLYTTPSDCYFSFSLKAAQSFGGLLGGMMWLFDMGVGKRFNLENDYFIETNFHLGTGIINDRSLTSYDGRKLVFELASPFNLLMSVSVGKQFGKQWVKTSISPVLDLYAKGRVFVEGSGLAVYKPSSHFDLLLSIAYDVEILENLHFSTYADFHSMRFEMMLGAGMRMAFGENKNKPLKYPKIKLKGLKRTYLK